MKSEIEENTEYDNWDDAGEDDDTVCEETTEAHDRRAFDMLAKNPVADPNIDEIWS